MLVMYQAFPTPRTWLNHTLKHVHQLATPSRVQLRMPLNEKKELLTTYSRKVVSLKDNILTGLCILIVECTYSKLLWIKALGGRIRM